MKILNSTFPLLVLTLIVSCNYVPINEYDKLKNENESLLKELEELKYGPANLLSSAKTSIENKAFNMAKIDLVDLMNKHPNSQQAIEAKQLMGIVDSLVILDENEEKRKKTETEKAEKDRLANATKKMRVKVDDIENVTWYYDRSTPQYTSNNSFHAYIGKQQGNKPWLRFVIQYAAEDWLFIEKYIIKVDGQTYTLTENSYGEIKTDNGSGGIWEWLDRAVGPSEYKIIKAVANGKDVKIRFNGKDYYKDKTITENQKIALKNVLDAYEALGGEEVF